jgi:SAM-dependent methyltransferase
MPATYVFDNASVSATEQHRLLAELLDPFTTARLAETGVTRGWRCLEVGAGGGSIARWLAERVSPTGSVLATDVWPHHIPATPGLTVRTHDITRDPLPSAAFDLITARLVLRHLPNRPDVLRRLRTALRPGGWLQLDEFDIAYAPALLTPDPDLYAEFMAAKSRIIAAAGNDGSLGRHLAEQLREIGMVDVDPCPRIWAWRGGSPGARLLAHHTVALRNRLLAEGMTNGQLAALRTLFADPTFVASSYVTYSVHARRPVE